MKVCIIYGWAEGPAHSKLLRRALQQAGFSITRHAEQASVIIAHSGGCFMLPTQSKAQLVMLVGLPYWPGKHPLRSFSAKVRSELRDLAWYRKTFFNTVYFVSRPGLWIKMWRRWKRQLLPALEDATIVLVRNAHDVFMHPTDSESLANKKAWELKTLGGQHDDIWRNPKPYVQIIRTSLNI